MSEPASFDAFCQLWPPASDRERVRSYRVWQEMPAPERRAALSGAAVFLELRRQMGFGSRLSSAVYLFRKLWLNLT